MGDIRFAEQTIISLTLINQLVLLTQTQHFSDGTEVQTPTPVAARSTAWV